MGQLTVTQYYTASDMDILAVNILLTACFISNNKCYVLLQIVHD